MEFYQSISEYYDLIFQLGDKEKNWYKSLELPDKGIFLELGCGTGELCFFFTQFGEEVHGIDSDKGMINLANRKKTKLNITNIDFQLLDMLKIKEVFPKESFDIIFCMGNTIVHLKDKEQITVLIKIIKDILKPGGRFIFQIMNYEKILKENIKNLPLIENDKIRFERNMEFQKESNHLLFNTTLLIKNDGTLIKNSVKLYPLQKFEIEEILNKNKFSNYKFFGGFDRDEFQNNRDLLIGEVIK